MNENELRIRMADSKLIYQWEIPPDHPNFTGTDDLPEAYAVFENESFSGGVMVYARWDGQWKPNPWNLRTLIRHLMKRLEEDLLKRLEEAEGRNEEPTGRSRP